MAITTNLVGGRLLDSPPILGGVTAQGGRGGKCVLYWLLSSNIETRVDTRASGVIVAIMQG